MTAGTERGREPAWVDVLAWFDTIDAIIRGLGHSLNNRALALGATIESMDSRRPVGQELSSVLTREAERLAEQLRQLRALPFAAESEPMPLLLRDVLTAAVQLHRAHASLGTVPVYLDGTADAPPVLAPESRLMHALLVTLTALKDYASPGGVVRIDYAGTAELAEIRFTAERDPSDAHTSATPSLVRPTALTAALLHAARIEIEQRIGPQSATITWALPSLRAMRRLQREGQAATR
ncbi:MAG TPA: hypothetical protein VE861_13700 [Gemmatimonadaceae bacterium]|nr:hypothetical protein [Gemmatimonadaceae bacterium]